MSPGDSAYLLHCGGPGGPSSHVFSLPDNKCVASLDTNTHILAAMARSSMPATRQLTLPLPGSPAPARVKLLFPPVLREEEDFVFPLIVNM